MTLKIFHNRQFYLWIHAGLLCDGAQHLVRGGRAVLDHLAHLLRLEGGLLVGGVLELVLGMVTM